MCDVLLRPKIYRPALTHDLTAVKEGVALPVMIKFCCQKYLWMVENIQQIQVPAMVIYYTRFF